MPFSLELYNNDRVKASNRLHNGVLDYIEVLEETSSEFYVRLILLKIGHLGLQLLARPVDRDGDWRRRLYGYIDQEALAVGRDLVMAV
jgi:hypothetical protein